MKSVYFRIIIISVVFLLALAISAYFIYKSYLDLNRELVQRTSLVLGQVVEDALRNVADRKLENLTPNEKNRLRALMNSMTTQEGRIIHILLINKNMRILLSSDRAVEGREYKSEQELALLTGEEPLVLTKAWNDSLRVLDVILPLKNDQGEVFSFLRLVLSYQGLFSPYKDLFFVFLPLAIMYVVLLIFLFYLLSREYARPLKLLEDMARKIKEGDYKKAVDYQVPYEYTDAFKVINETIKKVGVLSEGYKKAEKRMTNMLQVIDESIVILDSKGKVSGYNTAAEKLLRCPSDQKFAQYFDQIKAGSRDLSDAISMAAREGRLVENKEIVIWLPDGQDLSIRISCQVSREDNKISGILLAMKNMYLLRELEFNLQRSMQFGVIANLTSSIGHEMKNPLGALAMHAESLNSNVNKSNLATDPKIKKSITVLQNEVQRLNRIITQFLNLTKAKPVNLALININRVVEDTLLLIQQQAIERNIQLSTNLQENIDLIYGDADQIKQVLLNLVLNAFQAIDKNGNVSIRTRSIEKRILLDISDDGKGMTPEEQKRVFELYYTTKEDGAGIGLTTCKNIMQLHDGRITFESVQGKGTMFTLDFPRKDQTTQTTIPLLRTRSSTR